MSRAGSRTSTAAINPRPAHITIYGDDDLVAWVAALDDLFALVAGRFGRVEPRRRARAYARGLHTIASPTQPNDTQNGHSSVQSTVDRAGGPAEHSGGYSRALTSSAFLPSWPADGRTACPNRIFIRTTPYQERSLMPRYGPGLEAGPGLLPGLL